MREKFHGHTPPVKSTKIFNLENFRLYAYGIPQIQRSSLKIIIMLLFTIFIVNMFIFISATCTSPLHVLQIEDPSIRTDNDLPRSELNDTLDT